MYYLLIAVAVAMFGGCFALNDVYRKMRGSSFHISMESALVGSVASLIVLLAASGFSPDLSPRTILLAALSAINGLAFTVCAFRALDVINLSLFSMFSMLGGMLLPFLQGVLFYDEALTVGKIICVILITVALAVTVDRGEKKTGKIYYVGIFVLNGTAGMLSKIYTAPLPENADTTGYYIWSAVITIVVSGVYLLCRIGKQKGQKPYTLLAGTVAALNGGVNKVANWFLTITLAGGVHASVQYPIVTGGVMIVSTLICLFGARKPSKKELCAVLLASVGIAALLLPV